MADLYMTGFAVYRNCAGFGPRSFDLSFDLGFDLGFDRHFFGSKLVQSQFGAPVHQAILGLVVGLSRTISGLWGSPKFVWGLVLAALPDHFCAGFGALPGHFWALGAALP